MRQLLKDGTGHEQKEESVRRSGAGSLSLWFQRWRCRRKFGTIGGTPVQFVVSTFVRVLEEQVSATYHPLHLCFSYELAAHDLIDRRLRLPAGRDGTPRRRFVDA